MEKKNIKKNIIFPNDPQYMDSITELVEYKFNQKGELVHKISNKKFGKESECDYELIAIYVSKYIEYCLTSLFHMHTLYVPNYLSDFSERNIMLPQCKILTSHDFPSNPKCIILIQGNGAVCLGQWARSVCMNDNLTLGSMIPYVERAQNLKYSIIIFNPNERFDVDNGTIEIPEFTTMEKHSLYVYENIVKKNKNIKEIYIVAHSYGGVCTMEILKKNIKDLENGKIKKIGFTDSAHKYNHELGKVAEKKFIQISRNYVRSNRPIGTFIKSHKDSNGGTDCYSSGHMIHEYTSGSAINEIFKFFSK